MRLRPLSAAEADAIASWRYPGEYATYDCDDADALVDPANEFHAALVDAALVGYCCFGSAARVDGMAEEDGVLDVGWGLRPDLIGHGLGPRLIEEALRRGRELHAPREFRIAVLRWNLRAQRVPAKLGFREAGSVTADSDDYVLMTCPA